MSLSNTAVPIYYGQFREKVLSGEIPVCHEIEMEMNRIDALIRDPAIYYDDQAVTGFVKFCERELTLTNGSNMVLMDSFKLWAEQLFGWYYFVDRSVFIPGGEFDVGHYETRTIRKRLINKQYLIVARGAAKTMYGACLHAYRLVVDQSTTFQITTAPTMRQAEEMLNPIRTAITRARGPLFQMLTEGSIQNTTGSKAMRPKLASTKKGIEQFITGSSLEIYPMQIDRLQGLKPSLATVDEWLSGDIRENPIGAIEQGASKEQGGVENSDYTIVAMSSEGTVRNGSGDDIKMELMKILRGEYVAPNVSIFYYRLDDIREVNDPRMWIKAQPNLGITVSYETYQRDVERAEKVPAARNDILAKRFGIPSEGYTYFFTYDDIQLHRKREFWKMPCSMGVDLSRGDDFCAFTFLFPLPGDEFGVKALCYISSVNLYKLPSAMRRKYDEFIQEGTLRVMEGVTLDMPQVYEDLDHFINDSAFQYDVRTVGYDPYNAKEFMELWVHDNGEYGVEKVIQGAKTESVPLGELKLLAEERKLLFDESIMNFTMGNCVTLEDTNGNRKLLKLRYDKKIDSVSAMMDAYVAYKLHRDDFE